MCNHLNSIRKSHTELIETVMLQHVLSYFVACEVHFSAVRAHALVELYSRVLRSDVLLQVFRCLILFSTI